MPSDLKLTPTVLLHWFCGDGTCNRTGGLTFCTDGFSRRDVDFLIKRLRDDLGIFATRAKGRKRGQYKVLVNRRDEAIKVKNLIGGVVPRCCRYKLRFVRPTLSSEELSELRRKLTDKQIQRLSDRIRAARKRGVTMTRLASKYKMSLTTLYDALSKGSAT